MRLIKDFQNAAIIKSVTVDFSWEEYIKDIDIVSLAISNDDATNRIIDYMSSGQNIGVFLRHGVDQNATPIINYDTIRVDDFGGCHIKT